VLSHYVWSVLKVECQDCINQFQHRLFPCEYVFGRSTFLLVFQFAIQMDGFKIADRPGRQWDAGAGQSMQVVQHPVDFTAAGSTAPVLPAHFLEESVPSVLCSTTIPWLMLKMEFAVLVATKTAPAKRCQNLKLLINRTYFGALVAGALSFQPPSCCWFKYVTCLIVGSKSGHACFLCFLSSTHWRV
jgi:hypothetical protein